MMSFLSRSRRPARHQSVVWHESKTLNGVRFAVREPSLASRIELTRRLHEFTIKSEFLAGGKEPEQLELALAELLVQKELIEWGLVQIEGLRLNGTKPTVAALIESGPESLVAEIGLCIRARCGLSEEERKN
jgi:hypothetical protein